MLTTLLIGTAQSYLVALGLFLGKEKSPKNLNSVYLFCAAGTVLLLSFLTLSDIYRELMSDFQPLFLAITAPLAYRFYCYVTQSDPAWPKLHFLPTVLIAGLVLMGILSGDADKRHVLHAVACVASSALLVGMHIFFLTQNFHLFRDPSKKDRAILNILLAMIGSSMLASLIQITASLLVDMMLMKYAALLLVVALTILLLFSHRFPELLRAVETQHKKYAQSKLKNIKIEDLGAGVQTLMENEKIYLNLEITLSEVAGRLSVTAHQLSEYLNKYLGKSFNEFIIEYRVAEAKRLLTENMRMTNLEICYQSGFKSKSNFNSAFKQLVGMTPTDFRKMA